MIKFTDEIMQGWIENLPRLKQSNRSAGNLYLGQQFAIETMLVALESAITRIQESELIISELRKSSVSDSVLTGALQSSDTTIPKIN